MKRLSDTSRVSEWLTSGERRVVMPANAGIQVTDSVRHTVGKRYPGHGGWTPVFTGLTKNAWIPAGGVLSVVEGPE
jgi:hypothetical protein